MPPNELLALIDRLAAEGATELDLSGQGLSELPPEIGKLTQLETLTLGKWDEEKYEHVGNQLTDLPDEIVNLTNLTELDLSSNRITQIPDSISRLSNLTKLYLWGNQLTEIPDSITQLSNLTELHLGGNQITQIPDSITQLSKLRVLYLWGNQITQIPDSITQLFNLKLLVLWGNQITQIPDSITQLSKLRVLYLGRNQITQIPDSITQLFNLTELYLDNNQITQIPDSITQLSNLIVFSLHRNQITQIPDSITQLSNLTRLDLERNKITHLPESLESLPKLEKLDLRGNPLPISPEVLGPSDSGEDPGSVEGIFNYCRQLRSGNVLPLNEAKLLLVGQGSVGKTSLINRLLYNRHNPNESQTDGLNVTPWPIHVNSKDVKLNVWDFGGQEIYHATHQFFLTKRSLYVLVTNCRTSEDENRIDYWLKLIESFGDKSPVIIVGNKCDEQPLDLNRRALREKYPNIKAILETSCQDNKGIEELREAIYNEISILKEVYDLLPLSWFEVKQQLEQLNEDCINYAQYIKICVKQDIEAEKDQERLIGLLHNLGLVLNFRDHPILQNNTVLKPNWVTEGIYSLLSDDDLKTIGKGILTAADLLRVLDAERYPTSRHHFLTELINEFQLGFPLDLQKTRFLIPGLLPKEEPEDTQLEGETLGFQYHYAILPDSVLSRFIVLIHKKIHQNIYWRTGVMLAYREANEISNLARIKADPADQKIFISISGRESTRRSFLALIRDVFNRIHDSFANLEVTECVPVPGHPDHPPLDYQELLGLEEMGIQDYPIGKLRIKVNLRSLLDGYEPIESRQRQRMKDQGMEIEYREEMGMSGIHLHINQKNEDRRNTTHQHGKGDNVAGDYVQGDKRSGSDEAAER
ncbi:MAG: leucine-rich repeat domain-containing protein [Pegethrix bostrychoides GSE-TBD4-15B]|jgi:internalin A|uniref:non-specific serine/threonine protein kinase n=1 Tax=Pegethrix bostrychoides GSE-TBD4-15B TaxID=2839662 RepID=A0A951U3C0_9CYAN|nr:leucine-rich repeat domain-containing protein [Pegethrix bostrychoides GSE-TBD4-15B]